ncbi:hypothetical protein BHE74_00055212 [Ensete ventricosum]|nr:hypothetical protein BHE74_00055212 [Ensete ventricosum]
MGSPLCGRRRCPGGWTGAVPPQVVAPTGVVPASASLAGWRHPRRGRLCGRHPCKRQPCPRAVTLAGSSPGPVRPPLRGP